MNVEYMRTAKKSYMIVRQADYPFASYELHMIRQNDIGCLLPFQIILADGAAEYWYEVSGMQSLATRLSVESLEARQLRLLLENIMELKSAMEEYLLDDANISFSADMVYYDQTRDRIRFCYIPGFGAADMGGPGGQETEIGGKGRAVGSIGVGPGNGIMGQAGSPGLRELFEEILQHINHADPLAVRMGYEMYERSARAPFSMADCMDCLRIGERTPAESEEASIRERDVTWQSKTEGAPNVETGAESEDVEFLSDWPEPAEGHRKKRRQETKPWREKPAGAVREKRFDRDPDKESAKRRLRFHEEEREEEDELLFSLRPDSAALSEGNSKTEVIRAEDDAAEWKLTYKGNGIEKDLTPDSFPFFIGTDARRVNGALLARTVSRIHAKLYLEEGRLFVEDFNSTNGTYLNQKLLPMNTPAELKEGDRIVFATEEYEVYRRHAYGSVR